MYKGEFSLDEFGRPQSTAHRTRNYTTYTFLEVLRKSVLKFRKFYLCKTNPFYLALQECSLEFLASIKSGLKKNVLLSLFSEIVANLIGKGLS